VNKKLNNLVVSGCCVLLFTCPIFAKDDTQAIIENIEHVKEVQQNRVNIKKKINYDPFNTIKEVVNKQDSKKIKMKLKKKRVRYRKRKIIEREIIIKAIFGKSVFINNRWYREGQKIGSYHINEIANKTIILQRGRKIKEISLIKKNLFRVKDKK